MAKKPPISIRCLHCGIEFLKSDAEYNRQIRKGNRRFFCSRSCVRSESNKNPSQNRIEASRANLSKLRSEGRTIQIGPMSYFRYYLRKAKSRNEGSNTDLDLTYLSNLWEQQRGKCVYCGVELTLILYKNQRTNVSCSDIRFMASLDRIDSSRGYMKGNVQFVSASMNYAKGTLTDAQFREFIEMIRRTG